MAFVRRNLYSFLMLAQAAFFCGILPTIRENLVDKAVFVYIGEAMRNGQVPYRDIFDHKGPFLYFINYELIPHL